MWQGNCGLRTEGHCHLLGRQPSRAGGRLQWPIHHHCPRRRVDVRDRGRGHHRMLGLKPRVARLAPPSRRAVHGSGCRVLPLVRGTHHGYRGVLGCRYLRPDCCPDWPVHRRGGRGTLLVRAAHRRPGVLLGPAVAHTAAGRRVRRSGCRSGPGGTPQPRPGRVVFALWCLQQEAAAIESGESWPDRRGVRRELRRRPGRRCRCGLSPPLRG